MKEIGLLSKKYRDCEINVENKIMSFHGYKDEVANAKTEAALILTDKMHLKTEEYEEQMHLCKDIQWMYEEDREWKPFPLYQNAIIERSHTKKTSTVQ